MIPLAAFRHNHAAIVANAWFSDAITAQMLNNVCFPRKIFATSIKTLMQPCPANQLEMIDHDAVQDFIGSNLSGCTMHIVMCFSWVLTAARAYKGVRIFTIHLALLLRSIRTSSSMSTVPAALAAGASLSLAESIEQDLPL